MKPERELELARMRAHEAKMSRPARELFPREERGAKYVTCRRCGIEFKRVRKQGTPLAYCSGKCRDDYAKFGPVRSAG